MNLRIAVILLLCQVFLTLPGVAQDYFEVISPAILSFEKSPEPFSGDAHSQLSVSDEHFKHQEHALRWTWNEKKAKITIHQPIPYLSKNPNPNETSISTFIFWVYAKQPIDGKLTFEFKKQGRVCASFQYGLNFKGWHGAWVAFDRDMTGKPEEGMDQLDIIAPDTKTGELFFDHIILSSFQDSRHHTAGFSSPFINKDSNSHWLVLLKSWNKKLDIDCEETISAKQKKEIHAIERRMTEMLSNKKSVSIAQLRKQMESYSITPNSDGTLKGKSIFFLRNAECYFNIGGPQNTAWYNKDNRSLKQACEFLFTLANSYHNCSDKNQQEEIKQIYLTLTRHLLDQGFTAGSELGTLHHLGYSMRQFYTAHYLMKEVLQEASLREPVQQAMEWFAGTGEVKTAPSKPGMDIDAFNTNLVGRLSSILMMNDSPRKVAYLKAFSRWADNGYQYADGTDGCFKIDGTLFHHRANYPAYAVGGFSGAVNCIWLLQHTDFQISQSSHEHLKKALLMMRTYCNLQTWPLALSGRHPDGKGALYAWHFAKLASVGSPDGKEPIDKELASAYMRLIQFNKPDSFAKRFAKANIQAEQAPVGNWAVNYGCMDIQRRDQWSAIATGHSRYLWASEIYNGANLYGRYLNHGQLQILNQGNPISNFSNGFRQEGWDWNHIPGTTAAVVPMNELRANVRNLDTQSGYEEMLLSDQTFAGGVSSQGKNGLFAMILHEHDKYNGSLRAHKSYFFFDNRIICLGSNIQNHSAGHPAETTLFQDFLEKTDAPIYINGQSVNEFPYKQDFAGHIYLSDTRNNYYIVPKGNIRVTRMLQHSLDEETDEPTQNNFALASIVHGEQINNGRYEYLVLVDSDDKEARLSLKKSPYTVLQQDSMAHIVHDKASQTTGYVLFQKGAVKDKLIDNVNIPCLIMVKATAKNAITLSACDPDLRFYEGASDEIYDKDGKRIERSVYSRDWINNPSGKSSLSITLKGKWKMVPDKNDNWKVSYTNRETILTVTCQHGLTKEIELRK